MARPRLLFVSPQFLFPADAGGKIRTTGILRGMKGGVFDITLASPAAPGGPERHARALAGICDRFVAWPEPGENFARRALALFSRLPYSIAMDRSADGRKTVRALLDQGFDLVVADFVHAAVLFDRIPESAVLFTHNVEAEIFARHAKNTRGLFSRSVWRSQRRKMGAYEARILPDFAKVIAVSERDLGFFLETYGVRGAEAIPTGVDFDYFGQGASPPRAILNAQGGEIVFTGSMDWPANIDAMQFCMDAIWPAIAAARPKARLTVVGRDPPPSLIARARARGLNWRFTGLVEDVRPYVRDANVYVVTLRVGGGTRLKIYEAMAMRRPVVSTSIGVEGLPIEPGNHYRRADRPEDFAGEVLGLLDVPGEAAEMVEDAYDFILKRYSSRRVARMFEDICCRTLEIHDPALAVARPTPGLALAR
jgi:glycosyltransferase involved in cell wall biosynthesis